MWILPLLTLGVVSVATFTQGALVALVSVTDPGPVSGDLWFPFFLMLLGAVGMRATVMLTPER